MTALPGNLRRNVSVMWQLQQTGRESAKASGNCSAGRFLPELFAGCERSPEEGRSAVTCGPGPCIVGHRTRRAACRRELSLIPDFPPTTMFVPSNLVAWNTDAGSNGENQGRVGLRATRCGTSEVAKRTLSASRFANAARNMQK